MANIDGLLTLLPQGTQEQIIEDGGDYDAFRRWWLNTPIWNDDKQKLTEYLVNYAIGNILNRDC